MRACLAQVPTFTGSGVGCCHVEWRPLDEHGFNGTHYGWTFSTEVSVRSATARRHHYAEQVAARLVEWVRWPGERLDFDQLVERAAFRAHGHQWDWGKMRRYYTQAVRRRLRARGTHTREAVHPLDATPAGGLRPCLVQWEYIGGDKPEPIGEPEPDWPALAVVTDAMSAVSLWPALHAWRAPEYGAGVAAVLQPTQVALDTVRDAQADALAEMVRTVVQEGTT
jgi:hypothetical protein